MRPLILASLLAFILDQVSKYGVVHQLQLWRVQTIDVLPPILNFRYGENRGINFGLLGGDSETARYLLIAFSLALVAGVFWWVRGWQQSRRMQISAGLLIGGALGNVVDRLLYGYVLDFLNMSCCGIQNPFVFNVADVFIFIGAIGLILFDSSAKRRKKKAT